MTPQHSLFTGWPIASTLLRTVGAVALSAGCLGLTVVQQFRVRAAGRLLAERERLIDELLEVERRERRQLSEQLHDEALQYVLAARMDLEDVCDRTSPDALRRLDVALAHVSAFLRATVGQLQPVIVDQWGLPDALRRLADRLASDGGATVAVDSASWPSGAHTSADALLLATARELSSYLAGPAGATTVAVSVTTAGDQACLRVRSNENCFQHSDMARSSLTGRPGLAACRIRVEAAGGALECVPASPAGTVATVLMPAMPLPPISAT
jgi:two-component system, NarL family, sensor kinase